MRAALIATFPRRNSRAASSHVRRCAELTRYRETRGRAEPPRATADAPSPAHEPPLIAYALELS